jgi:hypothetical protein
LSPAPCQPEAPASAQEHAVTASTSAPRLNEIT